MKTISKGAIFGVTVTISDAILETMKHAPQIVEAAMLEATTYWHSKVLPLHFKKDAHERYGYAQRSRNYLKQKRGKPDLIASGAMRRDLTGNAGFKVTGNGIELRMFSRTLNFVPNMQQNNPDLYVTHKGRKGTTKTYPNLKREIKVITDDEREAVAQIIVGRLDRAFGDVEGRESDD